MSRNTKFRVRSKRDGSLLGYEWLNEFGRWMVEDITTSKVFPGTATYDSVTIREQYTGLKDKNGVEIYEGDVLQSRYRNKRGNELWRVTWDSKATIQCGFQCVARNGIANPLNYAFSISRELEVIGNIYENQELLEAKS